MSFTLLESFVSDGRCDDSHADGSITSSVDVLNAVDFSNGESRDVMV
jgi:hypothetical protein